MDAAIVGAGSAGLLHAWALRTRQVRVAHVFDPDRARAENFATVFGARVHDSLDSLARAGADCVSICSPPVAHAEQAERVAEGAAGRSCLVLVEKPVGVSREDLTRLIDVPRCVPIMQWRAGRSLQALRRAIAAGLLGGAPSITVDMTLRRDAHYFEGGRRDRETWGCGALLSVGIHALDALVYIFGKSVASSWSAFDGDPRAAGAGERAAVVAMAFTGGGLATLRITFDASGPDTTRIAAAGRGVTAVLCGNESDPTCAPIAWTAGDASLRARLEAMESSSGGHCGAPLLVPYIGEAIDAFRAGFAPGQHDALPTIAAVAVAHRIALDAYEAAR